MNDVKFFGKDENEWKSIFHTIKCFSDDFGMDFGLDKDAKLTCNTRRIAKAQSVELYFVTNIREP